MTAQFEALEPSKIKMTLSVTMQMEEWIELQQELKNISYTSQYSPSRSLSSYIDDMVESASKHFFPNYSK